MTTSLMSARPIAPDDLRRGQYVAVLHEIRDYHYVNCESGTLRSARVSVTPPYTDYPVKVASVCLPYVFVEEANGDTDILDVRLNALALVPARFAAMIHDRERRRRKRESF